MYKYITSLIIYTFSEHKPIHVSRALTRDRGSNSGPLPVQGPFGLELPTRSLMQMTFSEISIFNNSHCVVSISFFGECWLFFLFLRNTLYLVFLFSTLFLGSLTKLLVELVDPITNKWQ